MFQNGSVTFRIGQDLTNAFINLKPCVISPELELKLEEIFLKNKVFSPDP